MVFSFYFLNLYIVPFLVFTFPIVVFPIVNRRAPAWQQDRPLFVKKHQLFLIKILKN